MKVFQFTDGHRTEKELLVELLPSASGVKAVWHDAEYQAEIEANGPGVLGDDGKMVLVDSAELLHRYAPKLYRRSSMMVVVSD